MTEGHINYLLRMIAALQREIYDLNTRLEAIEPHVTITAATPTTSVRDLKAKIAGTESFKPARTRKKTKWIPY